jgi:hypothetical protein
MAHTDWWPVLLDGSLGAAIGTFGAFGAALYVVKRQSKADRALAREERRTAAVTALLSISYDAMRELDNLPSVIEGNNINDLTRAFQLFEDRVESAEPLAAAVGGAVNTAYEQLLEAVEVIDGMVLYDRGSAEERMDAYLVALDRLGMFIGNLQVYLTAAFSDDELT